MESGHPSRDVGVNAKNTVSPIGPTGEPLEVSPRERPTGGVSSRSHNPGVRSVRTGTNGVGVRATGLEESPLMWHHFWPPSLYVASTLIGALTNRVVLVSRQPGFCFWVFFLLFG